MMCTRSSILVVLVCAVILVQCESDAVTKSRFLYGNATFSGFTIPYRYFVPADYSPSKTYALITFLHGLGERGSDNEVQLIRTPLILAKDTVQAQYKFFILAPQCPNTTYWQSSGKLRSTVKQAQDDLITRYPGIDGVNLRFVTGLSLGSFGTWSMVNQFGGLYTKIVPISGATGLPVVERYRNTSIWAFHSSDDQTVSPTTTNGWVTRLRADNQTVLFSDPLAGHVCDDEVYKNFPVIDWLFNTTGTGTVPGETSSQTSTVSATVTSSTTSSSGTTDTTGTTGTTTGTSETETTTGTSGTTGTTTGTSGSSCISYIGCYKDNTTARDLSGHVWSNANTTIELCKDRCQTRSFTYFGLQYYTQCYCDNDYGAYGAGVESECYYACGGNSAQTCGGSKRNSVYQILC